MEFDGQPVTGADLRALALYGYGHFTSMRVDDGRVRGWSLHMERLVRDSRVLFDAELDTATIRHLVRRAVVASPSPTIVRVTVCSPDIELGHPGLRLEPHLLVSTRPATTGDLSPLRLTAVPYQRELPEIKHVGLMATIYHRRLAQRAGFDDVLFVDASGRVSEGATWNVGFVDGDQMIWPQANWLPGVTMRLVSDIAAKIGIGCTTRPVHLAGLERMQAAFIANAGVGLRPVSAIDDTVFDPSCELVESLHNAYANLEGETI